MPTPVTRHLTILLTDIKGFTDKTSRRSRSDIQALLDRHKQIVLPVLEGRGGKLIKTIGDAFLMVFESPTDAVLAGVAVQEALAKHNSGAAEDDRIDVRIAINAGEVNISDNDVFGEAVNITARIEGIAHAGQVFFTEAVYLAMNKAEVPSSEVGLLQLKGIPEKVRVYKVKREQPVEGREEPAPPVSGLWALLRPGPKPRAPSPLEEPPPKAVMVASPIAARPSVWRRAAALAVDGILCGMLVSLLVGGRDEQVRVRYDKRPQKQASAGRELEIGKDGIKIAADGAKVSVGKEGISIQETGVPKETRVEANADEDEETIYEKDGLKVAKKSQRRKVAFALMWLAYSTLFLGLWKATPGKRILKLTVVKMDGSLIDWKDAFIRSLFTLISGSAAFIGYLWALWERDRRGWHDLLAGTRVASKD